ncbi:MAG TPA: FkbM family methyltransferase [Opitutus sp.]|nr:FkbM family methyltransferase [Opitutus sp.]
MNIEPDPVLFEAFPRHWPRDINLNVGVGPTAGEMVFFRMANPLLNTFSAEEAERIARDEGIPIASRTRVRIENITTLLDRWDFTPDFLTIDTEGHDLLILQSYDFTRRRPAVICVETLTFSTQSRGRKLPEITECLLRVGYRVHADTQINTLFVDGSRMPSSR